MNTQNARPITVPSLFWWRWLIVATVFIIFVGLAMVVIAEPVSQMFGLILSAPQSEDMSARAYLLLFQGVLGGTMAGWGMALLLILLGSFRCGSKEGWTTIAASLATWFILDSSFSLWTGFWQNAVLNTVFLMLFAIPLAATRRTFFQK